MSSLLRKRIPFLTFGNIKFDQLRRLIFLLSQGTNAIQILTEHILLKILGVVTAAPLGIFVDYQIAIEFDVNGQTPILRLKHSFLY